MRELFSKSYDKNSYHCVHYVVDVWEHITGNDLSDQFKPLLLPLTKASVVKEVWDGFTEVDSPASPCMVLMRSTIDEPHMGVYNAGRVVHLRKTGPHAAGLSQLRREYPHMRFFICEN